MKQGHCFVSNMVVNVIVTGLFDLLYWSEKHNSLNIEDPFCKRVFSLLIKDFI